MPTNQNAYNSRVTDEALEKKFRDTFKSQGGAELVDDLYASGVIVPVVDFTAAAEGSALREDLQTAFDGATVGQNYNSPGTNVIINSTGFWRCNMFSAISASTITGKVDFFIRTTSGTHTVFRIDAIGTGSTDPEFGFSNDLVVYLRAGDTFEVTLASVEARANIAYRQIADVSGNLVNPLGFTSS